MLATILSLFLALQSANAVTITPINNGTDEESGGVRTIYYPIIGDTAAGGCLNGAGSSVKTFKSALNDITATDPTSTTTGQLQFKIVATKTRSQIFDGGATTNPASDDVSVRVEINDNLHTNIVPIFKNGGSYTTGGPGIGKTIQYTSDGAELTVGIALADNFDGTGVAGYCSTYSGLTNCRNGLTGTTSTTKSLLIGIAKTGSTFADANADFSTVSISFSDCPPHNTAGLTIPNPMNFSLVPGDQRIRMVNATVAPADGVTGISKVVVFGTKASTTPTVSNSTVIAPFEDEAGGIYTLEGLENEKQHCFSLGYVNKAGLLSTDSTWSSTLPTSNGSNSTCATPSQIEGFLNRSTCFIASAAYGDEWDPRLETLRQFRDQVLDRFELGRKFVRWYYDWSPGAASWLLEHPGYQSAVRVALMPLVLTAKAALWIKNTIR